MVLICKNADNTIRWKEGERLDQLFEQRCDQFASQGDEGHLAVVTESGVLTFRDLDQRANQTARYLTQQGLGAGDRIGLLFDKSIETYVALLAVLKINAAYVPLDAGFPEERLAFIVEDANVKAIVCLSALASKLEGLAVPKLFLDTAGGAIAQQATARLGPSERAAPVDQLCYVIYTSGTTGKPKGVVIEHPSICNFVKVAGEVYGYRQDDRVYQGMTIAFDFSVEELWVPLIAGATLVPGKPGTNLVGDDLADYLEERQVTAMCCVPTLLATIERDLPRLRFLLVSGEACPQNLVAALASPGPPAAQRLRSHRGDGHGHPDRAGPAQASDHWRPPADVLHRHSRREQGRGGRARRSRRNRHRRHRPGPGLSESPRADASGSSFRISWTSRTTPRSASIARAISAASTSRTRSSSLAGSIPRSRSEAIASSWPRSRRCCWSCRRSARRSSTPTKPNRARSSWSRITP